MNITNTNQLDKIKQDYFNLPSIDLLDRAVCLVGWKVYFMEFRSDTDGIGVGLEVGPVKSALLKDLRSVLEDELTLTAAVSSTFFASDGAERKYV